MKIAMLFASAMLVGATLAPPVGGGKALAAGPEFCREYANAAVRQAHRVRESGRCIRAAEINPARWSERFAVHYDWCRGVPAPEANAERAARRIHLERCR
ncbi:MAG: hypothetical protein ACREFC_06355 [Stellaceae bacterium]